MAKNREIRVIWDMWVIVNEHVIAAQCVCSANHL